MEFALHLRNAHHILARQVTTSLGKGLVFELNHLRTRALKLFDRSLGVQSISKPRVRIDNDRQIHALGDQRERLTDLRGGGQAHIRAPQAGIGDRSP